MSNELIGDYEITINSDSYEEEDDEKDLVILKLKKITIKINYSQLCKHSRLIRSKYLISDVKNNLSSEIQKLQDQYNIQDENIIFFFKLLREEKFKMTKEKFSDIYKLSQFFQSKNLIRKLKLYLNSNFDDVDLRIQFILIELEKERSNKNYLNDTKYDVKVQMQYYLIENINECLKSLIFEKLPISMIYQTIEKVNRDQIQNDLLYDFIFKSIKDFYVLFNFLDIRKLSEEKQQSLLNYFSNSIEDSEKVVYMQHIACNIDFIKELKEKIFNIQEQNNNLTNEMNFIRTQFDPISNENIQLKNELIQKENEITSLQNQINDLTNENTQLKNYIKEQDLLHIKQNEELINKSKNEKNLLENQIKVIEQQKDEIQTKLKDFNRSNEEFSRGINTIFGTKNERNMKSAILYLKTSSDKGNCFASYILGILFECDEGIEKSKDKMIFYYERSAEQGNSHGLNRIGYCYDIGHVVKSNFQESLNYYQRAADLGNSFAINNLGVLYLNGKRVEKNLEKAFDLFQKSASLGNSYALQNLGDMYRDGIFVKQDYAKAFENYQKSAELLDSKAFISLGDMYAKGLGVQMDLTKAKENYQKAKELGEPKADSLISKLPSMKKK